MKEHTTGFDIKLDHQSDFYGQLAVQGPEAEKVVEEVLGIPCSELKFYTAKVVGDIIISRTGYTGEDGFEIYGSHEFTQKSWDKLIESGRCKPCGLGCRDTSLRGRTSPLWRRTQRRHLSRYGRSLDVLQVG